MSLRVFAQRIRQRGRQVEQGADRITKQIAGAALTNVVLATPVDTGRARGGWTVSNGAPVFAETGRLDTSGIATIAAGQTQIAQRQSPQDIYLNNNVNYIVFLDQGTSQQAAENFVATAVSLAVSAVELRVFR